MQTDTQTFIQEEDFDYSDSDITESDRTYDEDRKREDEILGNDFDLSPQHSPVNEEITKLDNSVMELFRQSQENNLILREIGVELLAQSIVLKALYKQNDNFDVDLKQVVEIAIKNQASPITALEEPIKQIQEQARILVKARKPQQNHTAFGSSPFSRKAIALLFISQSCLVAFATAFTINQFPPKASIKTEQQLYSVFQRVDGLYKARFGNKIPKK